MVTANKRALGTLGADSRFLGNDFSALSPRQEEHFETVYRYYQEYRRSLCTQLTRAGGRYTLLTNQESFVSKSLGLLLLDAHY
jgi:hypothetical protein